MRDAVRTYLNAGYTVVALCGPKEDGSCGAGHRECRENPRNVGKVPLFDEHGEIITFGPGEEDAAAAFWTRVPSANVGIRLEESGLIVVDIDDFEALPPSWKDRLGAYEHYVISGRGRHIYFRRGDLPARNVRLEGLEVRGRGYVVAPPSRHRTGVVYRWTKGFFVVHDTIPSFLRDAIREAGQVEAAEIDWDHLPEVDISRIPLSIETRELIRFGAPKGHRSEAIWRVIGDLMRAGCSDEQIAAVLMNPEHLISEKIREKSPEQQKKYVAYQIAKMRAELKSGPASPDDPDPEPTGVPVHAPEAGVKTAQEIWTTDYPEPQWLVEGLLTEGLTILGGRSKIGKSWLVLDLALSVALGRPVWGSLPTTRGGVLYISLEDTERRLKKRMASVLQGDEPPANLYIATVWPRAMEPDPSNPKRPHPTGIKKLYWFLKGRPDVKLVIIDTFARFRTVSDRRQDIYQRDYEDVGILKEMADVLNVSILLVHHHRKGAADDIGEALNGSVGLPGAADTIWSLTRKGLQGVLSVAGRDVEEKTYALDFMREGYWVFRGEKQEAEDSDEERETLAVLEDLGEVSPTVLAETLQISVPAAKMRLHRLVQRGRVRRVGRGRYIIAVDTELNDVDEEGS